ncbi:hypothetical protein ACEV9B_06190 [Vibrio parahaemolyticus]
MKPRGTNRARKSAISASKLAFKKTNSPSRISAKALGSVNLKIAASKNKPTYETMPILDFSQDSNH